MLVRRSRSRMSRSEWLACERLDSGDMRLMA
jgi:hypothetical protein